MNTQTKQKIPVLQLCLTAVFMALICIATMVIQIPIPLGYAHLGDCMILLATYLLGPVAGMIASGIGSAMADILTGYAIWAIPTFLIKGIMPWVAFFFFRKKSKFSPYMGAIFCLLFMILGYVVAGCILYGSISTGVLQFPGLALKSVVNFIAFVLLQKLPWNKITQVG